MGREERTVATWQRALNTEAVAEAAKAPVEAIEGVAAAVRLVLARLVLDGVARAEIDGVIAFDLILDGIAVELGDHPVGRGVLDCVPLAAFFDADRVRDLVRERVAVLVRVGLGRTSVEGRQGRAILERAEVGTVIISLSPVVPPQQLTVPLNDREQLWNVPADTLTWLAEAAGGSVVWPSRFRPQHLALPEVDRQQEWEAPDDMAT